MNDSGSRKVQARTSAVSETRKLARRRLNGFGAHAIAMVSEVMGNNG